MVRLFILTLFSLSLFSLSGSIEAQTIKTKEQLQQELNDLQKQIDELSGTITKTQEQKASLNRDISVLEQKIKQNQLAIKSHEASVSRLNTSISEKDKNIGSLNNKLDREKDSLGQILRKTHYMDTDSLFDFTLQSKSLSEFFADVDDFSTIKKALSKSFDEIAITKNDLEKVKSELQDEKQEQLALKTQQELEKKKVQQNQKEKQNLLTVTKGQEKEYQKILGDKQKQAATIRAALFELSGAKAINFGTAYDLAVKAQKLTGVRPALLLGIITVESNLGENVGKGNWKVDMHPTRDQPLFEQITKELGLNPDDMPVSKKVWYGYGGAMGPAQFIPSTWVLYKAKVAQLTGHNPPSPWVPEDAFVASALLLKDNGAVAGNRASEFRAAMCYLAGCGNATKSSLQFYGNDVLSYADKYEAQIKILQGQ
jgi:peptidoglycan hydrolase CwlO-like protein